MSLRAAIEWGGDNLSEQLNRNCGLLPSGIYHGFRVTPSPGEAKVKISKDGHPLSLALVDKDVFQLHCTDETEPLLEVPIKETQKIYALVLDADYQWGQRRQTTYQLVEPAAKQAHHCELARLTVPPNADDSADYLIDERHRDEALHAGNLWPLAMIAPIAANLKGSKTIPPTGIVSRDGWMRCDGAPIPPGNALEGNTPNLTDGRFLRGSTKQTAGNSGGGAQVLSDLPAHDHAINHDHDGQIDTAGAHGHSGGTTDAGAHGHSGGTHNAGAHGHSGGTTDAGAHGHSGGTHNAGHHGHTPNINSAGHHGHGGGASTTGSHVHNGTTSYQGNHHHRTNHQGDHSHFRKSRGPDVHRRGGHIHSLHVVGNHNHGFVTRESGYHSHSLSVSGAGNHNHSLGIGGAGNHSHGLSISGVGNHGHNLGINTAGGHNHKLSIGGVGNHNHNLSISTAGGHNHKLTLSAHAGKSGQTGKGDAMLHLPRYFNVIYLIKVN